MTLSTPHQVMARLEEIDRDLAARQNDLEEAAFAHYKMVRERAVAHSTALLQAPDASITEKKARAEVTVGLMGIEEEARYESLNRVCKLLETRATIGQSLLKAHGRS